jgi:two-component system chemotaxis sensor kinase CheA
MPNKGSQVVHAESHKAVLELSDVLAAKLVAAESDDLPGLSAIHEDLEALCAALDGAVDVPAKTMSSQARELVERIVLRSVEDADEALRGVCSLVDDLQKLLSGASGRSGAAEGGEVASVSNTALLAEPPSDIGSNPPPEAVPAVKPDDVPLLNEFVAEARGHLEAAEAELLKLEETPDDAEAVNAIFRSFHTIKGVAGFLNLRQIGALAHAAESLLDLVRQSKVRVTESLADAVLQGADLLKVLIDAAEAAAAAGEPIPAEPKLAGMIRRLEQCCNATPSDTASPHIEEAAPPANETPSPASRTAPAAGEATVKIATGRLDALINMVGELVIAQAMVTQDMASDASANARLSRNAAHVGKIVRELQDLSMSMRMVPIQGLFQKMGRLVRDLCKKLHKEIDLVLTGGDTELDRNVVEVLGDPLMHMVRNAGDHGIETPEERQRNGKPPAGRLELRARHEAGIIVIEIIDDGKGLNKERILKKAIAAGIVAEGQELPEQEILRLIFHAGLSTAEKVTDVSGRGVGMDVVKKNIEALRGQIDIASTEGKGSTFTIRLPLTMAVIDGLVARVGGQRYIIPTTSIEQSLRPKEEQISMVQGRGEVCLVRGDVLAMFRLHRLFNIQEAAQNPSEVLVVIVQDNGRRCCLMVDELLGQQQVVIKSLGEGIGSVPGISGGAILGDGNVSLILDVHGLIDLASVNETTQNSVTLNSKERL